MGLTGFDQLVETRWRAEIVGISLKTDKNISVENTEVEPMSLKDLEEAYFGTPSLVS